MLQAISHHLRHLAPEIAAHCCAKLLLLHLNHVAPSRGRPVFDGLARHDDLDGDAQIEETQRHDPQIVEVLRPRRSAINRQHSDAAHHRVKDALVTALQPHGEDITVRHLCLLLHGVDRGPLFEAHHQLVRVLPRDVLVDRGVRPA